MDSFEGGGGDDGMVVAIAEACAKLPSSEGKRFVYINNTTVGGLDRGARSVFEANRVPAMLGMREGIRAVSEWVRLTQRQPAAAEPADEANWRERIAAARTEAEQIALLRDAGLPMAGTSTVDSADAAADAFTALGRPVVLKGTAPGLLHKTEHALVELDFGDAAAVRAAYEAIAERLRRLETQGEIVVQPMVAAGVELILGARHDPGFGTVIAVGVGGILVEVVKQASVRLAPLDETAAREMLDETPAGTLLRGTRGRGRSDIDAAANAIVAFARFAAAAGDALAAIEINPLVVLGRGHGAVGVDVVFEAGPE